MKRTAQFTLLFALLFVAALSNVSAQVKSEMSKPQLSAPGQLATKSSESPARIDVTPDVQQAFNVTNQGGSVAELVHENWLLKRQIVVLQARLLYKIPDDYEARVDDQGRLYFEKPAPPSPEKKEEPPAPKP
jgi:hypothetical protein